MLVNNCIGLRNMRSFVLFLFCSYLQAIGMIIRIVSVYWTAIVFGTIDDI